MHLRALPLLLAIVLLGVTGCTTLRPSREPANLSDLKEQLNQYAGSGAYQEDVGAVALRANRYVQQRIARAKVGERLAIVFDIDETTITNLPHMSSLDFGYVPKLWNTWIDQAQGPAIVPVQIVYDTAVRANIRVFFITGRLEAHRAGTERNLRAVGYETYHKIFFRPADAETTQAFKTAVRRQLVEEGFTIIANIGDQQSDLAGGYAEKTFKLPNPFYRTK
jgi:predicted secreted acid phosphatase